MNFKILGQVGQLNECSFTSINIELPTYPKTILLVDLHKKHSLRKHHAQSPTTAVSAPTAASKIGGL